MLASLGRGAPPISPAGGCRSPASSRNRYRSKCRGRRSSSAGNRRCAVPRDSIRRRMVRLGSRRRRDRNRLLDRLHALRSTVQRPPHLDELEITVKPKGDGRPRLVRRSSPNAVSIGWCCIHRACMGRPSTSSSPMPASISSARSDSTMKSPVDNVQAMHRPCRGEPTKRCRSRTWRVATTRRWTRLAAWIRSLPLAGEVLAVKACFDVAGWTTHAGSAVLADAPPAEIDAPMVARAAIARRDPSGADQHDGVRLRRAGPQRHLRHADDAVAAGRATSRRWLDVGRRGCRRARRRPTSPSAPTPADRYASRRRSAALPGSSRRRAATRPVG